MRRYKTGTHKKTDLKVHLTWIPKYRKRVLAGEVAMRTFEKSFGGGTFGREVILPSALEILLMN
jgi:hypothetical protein